VVIVQYLSTAYCLGINTRFILLIMSSQQSSFCRGNLVTALVAIEGSYGKLFDKFHYRYKFII